MSWERKTFRDYELPEGRTAESFLFMVEDLWAGRAVDAGYTDDWAEVARLIPATLDQAYDVRVTARSDVWESRGQALAPEVRQEPDGRREDQAEALRKAADAFEAMPPKLRGSYVAALRLYAAEPWRLGL